MFVFEQLCLHALVFVLCPVMKTLLHTKLIFNFKGVGPMQQLLCWCVGWK